MHDDLTLDQARDLVAALYGAVSASYQGRDDDVAVLTHSILVEHGSDMVTAAIVVAAAEQYRAISVELETDASLLVDTLCDLYVDGNGGPVIFIGLMESVGAYLEGRNRDVRNSLRGLLATHGDAAVVVDGIVLLASAIEWRSSQEARDRLEVVGELCLHAAR